MILEGKLLSRNGSLFFVYTTTLATEPTRTWSWWRMPGHWPHASYLDGAQAFLTYGVVTLMDGLFARKVPVDFNDRKPDHFESVSEPMPKIRGDLDRRWNDGRWEKLLKKGWVPA